ncbi:MAG: hypothetical protein CL676_12095 [Bdellovibrionaceae bacterium]|nr:hypothetical protein [Pseudobdellovibrionaceae bacterium]|tara:strand:- start:4169 stop:4600 length:432 start_codon:yes stop_codon:yes gene_type:complete
MNYFEAFLEIFRPPLCIYKVMKDPKNLHIYDNLIEAEGAKSFLEAHGITTTLPDRHALYHQPHLIGVLGGVRLQVASENYIQAKELLEQIEKRSQLKVVDVDSIRERYSEDRKRTSVKWLARIFSAGVVIYWVWVLAQHLKDS